MSHLLVRDIASMNASLREATLVRPVDADDAPAVAVHQRIENRHYVDQLPRESPLRESAWSARGLLRIDLTERSSRLGSEPADLDALLTLLHQIDRVREDGHDSAGRRWSSTLTPSAGGTHSIRSLLCADVTIPTKWHRAAATGIEEVSVSWSLGSGLINDAAAALRDTPKALLVAVAEPDVLLSRYPSGASLLWRDAGAYAATAQLVALSLGMQSRILGVTRELEAANRAVLPHVVAALALTGKAVT
jgi:hypothetical protein